MTKEEPPQKTNLLGFLSELINHYKFVSILIAALMPFLVAALQWMVWQYLTPFVWLLFYPAVFISAWIGGQTGGIIATLIAALLGTYFFIPTQSSWEIQDISYLHSIVVFVLMGVVFSCMHERFHQMKAKLEAIKDSQLELSQARLQMALESANAGLWEWNLQTNKNHWSDTLWDLYGLERHSCKPSHDAWQESIHPDDREKVISHVKRSAETASEILTEWRVNNEGRDQARWLMARGKPVLNTDGVPYLYRGIVVDITDRKKMEKSLQDREQRLDFALSTLHAGAWELDLNTHQANRTLLHDQIFGYSALLPEWTYEIDLEHILPEDREAVDRDLQEALANKSDWNSECRIRRTDGEIRWILAKGRHQLDSNGNVISIGGIVQDITESKQMATELQRWADAFHHCAHGIAISDPKTNCIHFCNRAYAAILGYDSPKDIEGLPILEVYAPEAHELVKKMLHQADQLGNIQYESLYRRKDGSNTQVQVDIIRVKDKNNQILYRVATIQDITERKTLELSFKEKKRLLSDSQTVAKIGSWMVMIKTGKLVWSDESFRLVGLSPEKDSLPSLEEFPLLLHPDDRPAMQAWIEACIAGEKPSGLEFRTREINGNFRWLYGCGQLETDSDGQPLRMIGTTQDITERKKIEEERQRMEARYRTLIDQATPDLMYIHDENGNFIEVNQRACDYDGYTKQELLSMSVMDLECGYDFPKLKDLWDNIEPSITKTVYGLHRRKDGSTFPTEINLGLMEENKQRFYIALVRDITERKQAEAQLLLQSKALDAAANAIMIANSEGIIEWINPAFTKLTGYEPNECVGIYSDSLFKCSVRQPEVFADVWKTISMGEIWHGEIVYPRKDGTLYTEEQTITPVIDDRGNIRHFIAIKQDITSRKQNEAQIEQYKNHLEQLVEERTRELSLAREEAVRLSQVKSAFLTNMSHEIRSPMNAMLGFFYLLEQRPLDPEARELVRKVHYAGQSLLGIINDILDFSKIESGHLEIEHVPFCLTDVLDQLAALMSSAVGDKDIELIINPCPSFANYLIGDGFRLQQVLVNLTSNAIKFTEKGEVELSINVIDGRKDDWINLHFAVSDTGIGISHEKKAEVFNSFTQADTTISRRFGGSGLGLAISRQLVNLMGGTLHVESEPGRGSKFWFELVLQRDQSDRKSGVELKDLKLLVADDCDTARNAILNMAKCLGWMVDAVDSGEAAYSQTLTHSASHQPYDIVLLDWKMPGLDGLTTAKAIKLKVNSEKRNRSEAPIVIMVSAFSRDELLAQNDIDYVDIVLSKPITPSSLFDAVLTVLDKREPGLSLIHDRLKRDLKISLSGVRVLVVDDSDINREIAQKILMFHGAEVYLANSGQEAIDWLLENPDSTDLVLMDVQMPDMDGYEAARAIRQYPVLVSLPIVALTAGAFTADQETALEAGMDDFIAKPFNVEQLIAVIYRLAKRQSGYKITTDSNSFKPIGFFTDTPNLSNHQDQILPIIDVDEGVNRFGNEEDYFTYLGKFINYYACAGNEISNLIQQGDNDAASALAHKLKGASGNLALKRVTKYTSQIEYSLRTGSPINDTGNLLQQALDQACVAILDLSSQKFDKETEQQYSYNFEGNDPEEITLLLKKLLNALDKDSPSAAEEILLSLKLRLPLDELTKIKTQIAVFDFESAKALTKKLIQKLIIS